ncbi:2-oxo acid dehydrogenase subunit E2 [Candidatus Giovannonibacteria bacterium]|nr:2-oxo acid dehydrogenase subunit E2 [Candidatus Giovannonibacteria bacterium]
MRAQVSIPFAGQTIFTAKIVEWFKRAGEKVRKDEAIAVVDTDKAAVEIYAPVSGVLEIVIPAGEEAKVAREDQEAEPIAFIEIEPNEAMQETPTAPPDIPKRILATSQIRRLSEERGIDLKNITGSGRGGKILRIDLEVSQPLKPADENSEEVITIGYIETLRAKKLEQSALIPRSSSRIEIDFTAVDQVRKELESKISPFYFVIWAGLKAMAQYPLLNSSFLGYENGKGEIRVSKSVHLGFSVDLGNDLRILMIENADKKSFGEIIREMREKTTRFKEGKSLVSDMGDYTIIFNNPGVFGAVAGEQLIGVAKSGPNAAIIGLMQIKTTPTAELDQYGMLCLGAADIGQLAISWDHRIFGGRYVLGYLIAMKKLLEDKEFILSIK